MFNSKALVIPMTSNSEAYYGAYDEKSNPGGSSHLMRLGLVKGLNRHSVLFLNDVKYINTARIIDIKAHINTDSILFKKIYQRFYKQSSLKKWCYNYYMSISLNLSKEKIFSSSIRRL